MAASVQISTDRGRFFHDQEKYIEELKIQIEWREPDVGPIDSPLNLSFYNNNIGCNFTVIENQSMKHSSLVT